MTKEIISIQYLRGIAAAIVVLRHLFSIGGIEYLFLPNLGGFGVDIFFVISGFIMWQTTVAADISTVEFWRRRIIRVVPLYWIFLSVLVILALSAPKLFNSTVITPENTIKSFFLKFLDGIVLAIVYRSNRLNGAILGLALVSVGILSRIMFASHEFGAFDNFVGLSPALIVAGSLALEPAIRRSEPRIPHPWECFIFDLPEPSLLPQAAGAGVAVSGALRVKRNFGCDIRRLRPRLCHCRRNPGLLRHRASNPAPVSAASHSDPGLG